MILTTGKEPGSETDSNVYINIAGEKGDTGRRMLLQSNNVSKFKVGQVGYILVFLGFCFYIVNFEYKETKILN